MTATSGMVQVGNSNKEKLFYASIDISVRMSMNSRVTLSLFEGSYGALVMTIEKGAQNILFVSPNSADMFGGGPNRV